MSSSRFWEWVWGEDEGELERIAWARFDPQRYYLDGRYRRSVAVKVGLAPGEEEWRKIERLTRAPDIYSEDEFRRETWARIVERFERAVGRSLGFGESSKMIAVRLIRGCLLPTLEGICEAEGERMWFRTPVVPGVADLWLEFFNERGQTILDELVVDLEEILFYVDRARATLWSRRFGAMVDMLKELWQTEVTTYRLLRGDL